MFCFSIGVFPADSGKRCAKIMIFGEIDNNYSIEVAANEKMLNFAD